MQCRDLDKRMDAYFDRQLTASVAGEIEVHLAECPSCARRWGRLRTLLTDPEPVQVPAGLRDRVMGALEAEWNAPHAAAVSAAGAWSRRVLWIRYVAPIAACVLFFLSGWFVSNWWKAGQPGPGTVAMTGESDGQVTILVSPWMLSSAAQAIAMPGPISPAVMLARGVVPELMTAAPGQDEPTIRIYQKPAAPSATQPAEPMSSPELRLLPLVPRYLGA